MKVMKDMETKIFNLENPILAKRNPLSIFTFKVAENLPTQK